LATNFALGLMLTQHKEEKNEQAIYYLSCTLIIYKTKYAHLEKLCLGIIFEAQNLRHYMLNKKIYVIYKMDPLKYMMNKKDLDARVITWIMFLTKFDVEVINQKSIKGQVIMDQLLEAP